jgi:hypothetical protein
MNFIFYLTFSSNFDSGGDLLAGPTAGRHVGLSTRSHASLYSLFFLTETALLKQCNDDSHK